MVALIGRFNKTPSERRELRFDYSNWLCDNETLQTFAPAVILPVDDIDDDDPPDTTPLVVNTAFIINPTTAIMFVEGGTVGFQYHVRLSVSTSATQRKEDGVLFYITPGVSG